MIVTVTGGSTGRPISVALQDGSPAALQAQALASAITSAFQNSPATIYATGGPNPHSGYLIVTSQTPGARINATGYEAVVVKDGRVADTIIGGGAAGTQTVLGGLGKLNFRASSGSVILDAGGADNIVYLAGDTSSASVYVGGGGNTITGADGATYIALAGSDNDVRLGAGPSTVTGASNSAIHLGTGAATVSGNGGDTVYAAQTTNATGFNLTFVGGNVASTVLGGDGSYSIFGGAGGGQFTGGSSGMNSILGGTGRVTIFGGGAHDTLQAGAGGGVIRGSSEGYGSLVGGSGRTTIFGGGSNTTILGGTGGGQFHAGGGNETLIGAAGQTTLYGGSGQDVIRFGGGGETYRGLAGTIADIQFVNGAGNGATDYLFGWTSKDVIDLAATHESLNGGITYAGHNTEFTLTDGTRVVVHGAHLTMSNFKF